MDLLDLNKMIFEPKEEGREGGGGVGVGVMQAIQMIRERPKKKGKTHQPNTPSLCRGRRRLGVFLEGERKRASVLTESVFETVETTPKRGRARDNLCPDVRRLAWTVCVLKQQDAKGPPSPLSKNNGARGESEGKLSWPRRLTSSTDGRPNIHKQTPAPFRPSLPSLLKCLASWMKGILV